MAGLAQQHRTARRAVAQALAVAAEAYPAMPPVSIDTAGLDAREARLAVAVFRAALQRWITLEYLLDRHLRKPIHQIEPVLRGVLLSGAAQLLCFDRLPAHAVVNESVALARSMVRPGAAGLVNAVLRRFSGLVDCGEPGQPWSPDADRLPLDRGSLRLHDALLPNPASLTEYLSIATSHPKELVDRWVQRYGSQQATAICRQGVRTPPTILAAPGGITPGDDDGDVLANCAKPHDQPGYWVWGDTHDKLVGFLAGQPAWRVQDPASALAVQATAELPVQVCVDGCAGLGTKTRQIRMTHSGARVIATDVDTLRLAELRRVFDGDDAATVIEPRALKSVCQPGSVDLLLLDVPCTNSGALARRPEARYRFSGDSLASLVKLQRNIIRDTVGLLRPGGWLLYSTCSLEQEENGDQALWVAQQFYAQIIHQSQTLPEGADTGYHDGSYHALIQWPGGT